MTTKAPSRTKASIAPADYPSLAYGAAVVGVLFFAYLVAYLDRQIISILIPALKAGLKVSDTQVSLLQGMGFTLFFALAGLPLGRLADRANRRNLIAIGIAVWSLATMASGLATNFWQLFAARMMVGAGEACLAPASVSLIADSFPPARRGRALTVMQSGMPLGTTLSLFGGGLLLSARASGSDLGGLAPLDWPPWKVIFLAVGAPGLVVALLVACLREPRRMEVALEADDGVKPSLLHLLGRHPGTYFGICAIAALMAVIGYGVSGWAPTVLMRIHKLTPAQAGGTLGLIMLTCSVTATFGAGFLSDALARRRPVEGRALAPLILLPVLVAALLGLMFATAVQGAVAAMAVATFAFSMVNATVWPAIQAVTPNRFRGQMIAFIVLVSNIAGLGLAPTLIAVVNDYLMRDEMRLQQSVAGVSLAAALAALATAMALPRFYRRAVQGGSI